MGTKDPKPLYIKLLAKRIRQLRKDAGYSNYENWAYDHDFPRAQFGRYEQGQDIRFTSIVKLAKAFGLTVEEFFAEGFDELDR